METSNVSIANGQISLSGDWRVNTIAETKQKLRSAWPAKSAVAIDLEKISSCDTAGAQLLCSWIDSLHKQGIELRITGVSVSVAQAMQTIGFDLEHFLTNN